MAALIPLIPGPAGTSFVGHTATADPTVNDDTGDGYAVGSHWLNTTSEAVFVALDATTGAAVWREQVLLNADGELVGPIKPRLILSTDTTDIPSLGEHVIIVDSLTAPTTAGARVGDGVTVHGVAMSPDLSGYASLSAANTFTADQILRNTNGNDGCSLDMSAPAVTASGTAGSINMSAGYYGGTSGSIDMSNPGGGNAGSIDMSANGDGGSIDMRGASGYYAGSIHMSNINGTAGKIDMRGTNGGSGAILMGGNGYTPTLADGEIAMYPVGHSKLVIAYNDGGTMRYKYLDLSGTGVTWVHTTTAPS